MYLGTIATVDRILLYCLRYYDYDGLWALLQVGRGNDLVAAWAAREAEQPTTARTVWVGLGEQGLLEFLRSADSITGEADS